MPEDQIPTTPPKPTASELRILQHLWRHGPSTVRHIHRNMGGYDSVSYTTILKQLQIMHEKGLVERDEAQRAHVYAATQGEEGTQQAMLQDFLRRVYHGSTSKLVMQVLGNSSRADEDELAEIRKLLERIDREDQAGG